MADATFFLSPGKSTEAWAKDLNLEDFELLCLDGTRKPVTEAESCHLAVSPNHGVVSRKDKVEHLEQVLLEQQVGTARAPALS